MTRRERERRRKNRLDCQAAREAGRYGDYLPRNPEPMVWLAQHIGRLTATLRQTRADLRALRARVERLEARNV